MSGIRSPSPSDRRRSGAYDPRLLGRELAWLLLVKFAALGLLWLLFFAATHRPAVDASAASRQLAVAASSP